jgi:hypothetical protein
LKIYLRSDDFDIDFRSEKKWTDEMRWEAAFFLLLNECEKSIGRRHTMEGAYHILSRIAPKKAKDRFRHYWKLEMGASDPDEDDPIIGNE